MNECHSSLIKNSPNSSKAAIVSRTKCKLRNPQVSHQPSGYTIGGKGRLTWWVQLLDHLWKILLFEEEKQSSSGEQQEEAERTGDPPSPSTQGVHHHLPHRPQQDAARSDGNEISSEGNQSKQGVSKNQREQFYRTSMYICYRSQLLTSRPQEQSLRCRD